MDNFAGPWTAPRIVRDGVLAYPIPATDRTAYVSADNAAAAAVAALGREDLDGATLDLAGPESLTGDEAAERFGRVLDRPVRYQPIPLDAFERGLASAVGEVAAREIVKLYRWDAEQGDGRRNEVDPGPLLAQLPIGLTPLDAWITARPEFSEVGKTVGARLGYRGCSTSAGARGSKEEPVKIDVYHDTVCPWCRIGKKELDDALAAWTGPAPTIGWRPFLLDDHVPPEGIDFRSYMARSKGDANVEPMFEAVRRAGAPLGIEFRLDRLRFATNTLLSHRTIEIAPDERRGAVVDAIHRVYFEEGRDIGRTDVLVEIAEEASLDPAAVGRGLADPEALRRILDEAMGVRTLGVRAVPTFVFDDAAALSGA